MREYPETARRIAGGDDAFRVGVLAYTQSVYPQVLPDSEIESLIDERARAFVAGEQMVELPADPDERLKDRSGPRELTKAEMVSLEQWAEIAGQHGRRFVDEFRAGTHEERLRISWPALHWLVTRDSNPAASASDRARQDDIRDAVVAALVTLWVD